MLNSVRRELLVFALSPWSEAECNNDLGSYFQFNYFCCWSLPCYWLFLRTGAFDRWGKNQCDGRHRCAFTGKWALQFLLCTCHFFELFVLSRSFRIPHEFYFVPKINQNEAIWVISPSPLSLTMSHAKLLSLRYAFRSTMLRKYLTRSVGHSATIFVGSCYALRRSKLQCLSNTFELVCHPTKAINDFEMFDTFRT